MSGLAFSAAPAPALPLRFLATAVAWGVLSGLWLAWHGELVLASRWSPHALVMVHMLALGLLGNAMLGSLLQFLPVAAGSPLPWPRVYVPMHAAFNLGIGCLLPAFMPWPAARLLALAATLLLGACAVLSAAAVMLALRRGSGARVLREGIGLAVAALPATVLLGGLLLAARTGWLHPRTASWTDLHAMTGLAGWCVGLLATVGAVTLPMLQGTRTPPPWLLRAWMLLLVACLAAGLAGARQWLRASPGLALLPVALFATGVLVLQWRSPHVRNRPLRLAWCFAALALLAAAAAALLPLPGGIRPALAVGVLVLGIGLPATLLGMLLQVASFLAWIELRQRTPRGQRIPGVGQLVPAAAMYRALGLHLAASGLLLAAMAWPPLGHAAGLVMAATWTAAACTLAASWRHARGG